MSGSVRSVPLRRVVVIMGVGLLLLAGAVGTPTFRRSQAADIPFASPAFQTQWSATEATVPNFWGPADQPGLQEPYQEATGGSRLVQYFDKARMEQTTSGGTVTNGLLTVELISGQRQFGDATFAKFAPSSLPVVGDLSNAWPPYAALSGSVFAARVGTTNEPFGTVYKPDGTFGLNPGLAADPGAAFGSYQSDPGGKYAHNLPKAFDAFLTALPTPWQSAMGFPLTEPFWVNVKVNTTPVWVLVQPFERRVLSYTPTNPKGFQVEMGNIGQHYYQWRYVTNIGGTSDSSATTAPTVSGTPGTTTPAPTTSGTPGLTKTPTVSGTATASSTPTPLAISSVQLGTVSDTDFSLTFTTNLAATTEILYGTTSHSYDLRQDVSTTATQSHTVSLTNLQPGTKYYFALHATAGSASVQRREDYFSTASSVSIAGPGTPDAPTKTVSPSATPTATATPKPPTSTPTTPPTATTAPSATPKPTATPIPKTIRVTLNHATVNARNPTQLAASTLQLEGATVALTLAYDGMSGTATANAKLTTWTRDPANPTASSTNATPPLTLMDKQTMLTLTATATIPFTDPSTPTIVVTFTQKMTVAEYTAGTTVISPVLNNAKNPEYSVTLTFNVTLS